MLTYLLFTLLSLNIIGSGAYLLFKAVLAPLKVSVAQRLRYLGCIAVMLLFLVPFYQLIPIQAPDSKDGRTAPETAENTGIWEEGAYKDGRLSIGSHFDMRLFPSRSIQKTILLFWSLGVIFLWLWYLIVFCRFRRSLAPMCNQNVSVLLQQLAEQIAREQGIRHLPVIKVLPDIQGPMMVGFFRPLIVLPSDRLSLPDAALILKHELVHFKRRDLWWKLLAVVLQCIHWFNPLVWMLCRDFNFFAETSCDEEVVRNLEHDHRKRYGLLLISYVQLHPNFKSAAGISFSSANKKMKVRISVMLNGSKSKKLVTTAVVCVFAASCFTLSAFAAQTQKNVPSPVDGMVTDKDDPSFGFPQMLTGEMKKEIPFAEKINPDDGWNVNAKGKDNGQSLATGREDLPPLNIPDEFREAVMRGEVEPFSLDEDVTVFTAN